MRLINFFILFTLSQSILANAANEEYVNYYTKKYSFSEPKLDIKALQNDLLTEKIPGEFFIKGLELAAKSGDEEAEKKLHYFRTTQFLSHNFIDREKAEKLLKSALAKNRLWAIWHMAKQTPEDTVITKWHFMAANAGHKEATAIVGKQYDVAANLKISQITNPNSRDNRNKKQKMIKHFVQEYKTMGYGKPIYLLAKGIVTSKLKLSFDSNPLVKTAAKIGYKYAMKVYLTTLGEYGGAVDAEISGRAQQYAHDTDIAYLLSAYLHVTNKEKSLEYCMLAAEAGSRNAMQKMGCLLWEGANGVTANPEKAFHYFEQAAKLRDPLAMVNMGRILWRNRCENDPNDLKALEYFVDAANANNMEAHHYLGDLYHKGFYKQASDHATALRHYKFAASHGITASMYNCGTIYLEGFPGQEPDPVKAAEYLTKAADKKYLYAIKTLADLLKNGRGSLKANPTQALMYYRQASMLGDGLSSLKAGLMMETGYTGQAPDLHQAYRYYKKAEEQGYKKAAIYIGNVLKEGFPGQDPDLAQAFKYYEKAAKLGNSTALYLMGDLFETGFPGQKIDLDQAGQYYIQAMNNGNQLAPYKIGQLYVAGYNFSKKIISGLIDLLENTTFMQHYSDRCIGTLYYHGLPGEEPNFGRALKCFKKATKFGDILAVHLIGTILESGFDEHEANMHEAQKYYLIAAHKGCTNSMIPLINYYLSLGDDEHLKSALFWSESASMLGNENAKRYLKIAKRSLKKIEQQQLTKEEGEQESEEEEQIISESLDKKPGNDAELIQHNFITLKEQNPKEQDSNIIELPLCSDEAIAEQPKTIRNPKYIRSRLKEMGELRSRQNTQCDQIIEEKLSSQNQAIADCILNGEASETATITANNLYNLFNDRFFNGQIVITPTKRGMMIAAHNAQTGHHVNVATHKKHKKSYKGFDLNFLKDLKSILKLFI
jgi:TPR repeat protein